MPMTRKITWDAPAPKRARTNATEIARIKRTLGERKPEMKSRANGVSGTLANGAFAQIEVTDIAQGNAGLERDGTVIKLHRVDYTAFARETGTANPIAGIDVYLVTSKDANVPAYGDFLTLVGGTVNKNEFTTWVQDVVGGSNNGVVQGAHSFQFPMKIHYGGSASDSGIRNRTFLCMKNNTGTAVSHQLAFRSWYTDI